MIMHAVTGSMCTLINFHRGYFEGKAGGATGRWCWIQASDLMQRYASCFWRVEPTGEERTMSKLLRGVAAGWGASRLGGGCLSTVLIFVLLWWLLGYCGVFQ